MGLWQNKISQKKIIGEINALDFYENASLENRGKYLTKTTSQF